MPGCPRSRLARYGVATLIVAAALLLRWSLWPVLGPEIPFLLLWPAVLVAAWYGGYGPGLLATVLAAFAVDRLFLSPFGLWKPADAVGLTLFVLLGACISLVTSRLRRTEEELRRHAVELAEADRRKDHFLALLGHELRTPLSALRNAAEVLNLLTRGEEQVGQMAGVVDRQGRQLARLVDDLLDVSRFTRGKLRLQRERVELADVLDRAVECSRPLLESRRHELTEELPPGPVWVDADPARLAQVVSNLLNNAAKYTPEHGRVWLTAGVEGGELVVRVRDNGIGIKAEMLPRLFQPFAQAERALPHAQGGLGLGLTLVKDLVGLHGGSVIAQSEGPGRGSEFVVRLPVVVEAPAAQASARRPRAADAAVRSA